MAIRLQLLWKFTLRNAVTNGPTPECAKPMLLIMNCPFRDGVIHLIEGTLLFGFLVCVVMWMLDIFFNCQTSQAGLSVVALCYLFWCQFW